MRLEPFGVGERLRDGANARDLGPCRRQRSGHPARSASKQSARHAVGAQAPQTPEGAAHCCNSGMTALRGSELLISCRETRWSQCSAPCVVPTVVVWCDDLCSATALVHRLLRDNWLCDVCCRVSCLVPNALHVWMVFLRKFSVPCLVHVAPVAHFLPSSPSSLFVAAELLNVLIELAPNLPKLDRSVSVAVLRAAKRSPQTRRWCPLLEAAYHHRIGGFLAMRNCHRCKAALSQSCHFALFVNPVARASTDQFFTLCDVHLEHLEHERVLAGDMLAAQA